MLFADAVDVLQQFAIPIGIALAVVLMLAVPTLRQGVIDAFNQGKKDGDRMRGKKPEDGDQP